MRAAWDGALGAANCEDWSVGTSPTAGTAGHPGYGVTEEWTDQGEFLCFAAHHLYCISNRITLFWDGFDLTGDVPTLTCSLHDVLGDAVWEPLVLTPADLRNGVRSWDRKADPVELERLQRFKDGKGYYGFDKPPGWPRRRYPGEG